MARCPACERPVWATQLARIMGWATKRKGAGSLGFVAVTGKGRGWKVQRGLASLTEVLEVGGHEAVTQLRAFALQTLRRLWAFDLLTEEDLRECLSVRRLSGIMSPKTGPIVELPFYSAPPPAYVVPPVAQHAAPMRTLENLPFR